MEKYAIVETGSKQYWVAPQQVIEVELLDVAGGQKEVVWQCGLNGRNRR